MDLDSPSILGHPLPAELAHPFDRGHNALYFRQLELIQAGMTEEERKQDNEFMKLDWVYWKLIHLYYSTMKEEEDEEAWAYEYARLKREPWATEDGIASKKPAYMAKEKSRREKLQLADIERRKEKLGEKDPYNIFLKAKQLEEAKEQEARDLDAAKNKVVEDEDDYEDQDEDDFAPKGKVKGKYVLDYDLFSDSDSDEEQEGEEEPATTAEQTVNNAAATPPPPPRPSNAQLPPAGIGMAAFQKYKPAVPSKLRHVEEMSPLQIEKEKAKRESMGKQNMGKENQLDLRQIFMDAHPKYLARMAADGDIEFVGEDEEIAEEMAKWM